MIIIHYLYKYKIVKIIVILLFYNKNKCIKAV